MDGRNWSCSPGSPPPQSSSCRSTPDWSGCSPLSPFHLNCLVQLFYFFLFPTIFFISLHFFLFFLQFFPTIFLIFLYFFLFPAILLFSTHQLLPPPLLVLPQHLHLLQLVPLPHHCFCNQKLAQKLSKIFTEHFEWTFWTYICIILDEYVTRKLFVKTFRMFSNILIFGGGCWFCFLITASAKERNLVLKALKYSSIAFFEGCPKYGKLFSFWKHQIKH